MAWPRGKPRPRKGSAPSAAPLPTESPESAPVPVQQSEASLEPQYVSMHIDGGALGMAQRMRRAADEEQAAATASTNPDDVLMRGPQGQVTEVHKDSVPIMAGLGWQVV